MKLVHNASGQFIQPVHKVYSTHKASSSQPDATYLYNLLSFTTTSSISTNKIITITVINNPVQTLARRDLYRPPFSCTTTSFVQRTKSSQLRSSTSPFRLQPDATYIDLLSLAQPHPSFNERNHHNDGHQQARSDSSPKRPI
jgi:hypothetical protein